MRRGLTTLVAAALLVAACGTPSRSPSPDATAPSTPQATTTPSVSPTPSPSPAVLGTPTPSPSAASGVEALALGGQHSCALTTAGGVTCWGWNGYGQLGDGSTHARHTPVGVAGLSSGVTAIAAGADHTCALTAGGGATCWGRNSSGQLGDGALDARRSPGDVVGLASGVTAIAAGERHTCAVTTDGGVMCWGGNSLGQLGDGTTLDSPVPVVVAGLPDRVVSIAAGPDYTCAVTVGGAATCWGYRQQGDGTLDHSLVPAAIAGLESGVSAIAAGLYHTCTLTDGGGVKCWGAAGGVLGNGTRDGSVDPVGVTGLQSGVTAIAAGPYHTCALTDGGGVRCWGRGFALGLGDGTGADGTIPVDVAGLPGPASAIDAGGPRSCAVLVGGAAACWGENRYGALGDGTTTDSSIPVAVLPAAGRATTPAVEPSPSPSLATVPGEWVRLGDMSERRWSFEALELLDGRVFVIDQATCGGASDLHGPPDPPGPTDLLDPTTGDWTPAAALNAFRSGFVSALLPDGHVLVTGGDNGWYRSYSSTKLFDPATGQWTPTDLLNTARRDPIGATLPDGRVLVVGGTYSVGFDGEEDFFDPSGRASWPESRELTSAEIYDPRTGRWTRTGSLHDPASAGDAYTLPDGRVLAVGRVLTGGWVGGSDAGPVEVFDPATRKWTPAGSLARPGTSASVVLDDGSLLVIGGVTYDEVDGVTRPLPDVSRFDPATGTTRQVAPLPSGRSGAIAVRLRDGRVLVAGGIIEEHAGAADDVAPPTDTALVYDPGADVWSQAPPMPFADSPGQGLLLADGSVLVVGGGLPPDPRVTDNCGPVPVAWTARFAIASAP
jgi:alpha-tubulin suppressor-like RCC1 family protein